MKIIWLAIVISFWILFLLAIAWFGYVSWNTYQHQERGDKSLEIEVGNIKQDIHNLGVEIEHLNNAGVVEPPAEKLTN